MGAASGREAAAARGASAGVAAPLRSDRLIGAMETSPARADASVERGGALNVDARAEACVVVAAAAGTSLASTADRVCGFGAEETCVFARDAAGRKLSSLSADLPTCADASSCAGGASSWRRGASI